MILTERKIEKSNFEPIRATRMVGLLAHIMVNVSAWLTCAHRLAVHGLAMGRKITLWRRPALQPVILVLLMHLKRIMFVSIWLPVVDTLSWDKRMAE